MAKKISSPMQQVETYKKVLYNVFVPEIVTIKEKESKKYGIVSCAVYLNGPSLEDIISIRKQCSSFSKNNQNVILGNTFLNRACFGAILKDTWLNQPSRLFTDDLYDVFHKVFIPMEHTEEQGLEYNIVLSGKKKELSYSHENTQQKIRGVAGCGKTTILAYRAYYAAERIERETPVVIITFNITLRNYIRDKISAILPKEMKHRGRYIKENFIILHYSQFIRMYHDEYFLHYDIDDWKLESENGDESYAIPEYLEIKKKYPVILVDETQDYRPEWVKCIRRLLAPGGEIVFFADEKQGIYSRPMIFEDGKKRRMYTGIKGGWNELVENTNRMNSRLADLANAYQRSFLSGYEYEPLNVREGNLFEKKAMIYYKYMSDFSCNEVMDVFDKFYKKYGKHRGDICFLSNRIAVLIDLDKKYRTAASGYKDAKRTQTTFETAEELAELIKKYPTEDERRECIIRDIRRNRKFNFQRDAGVVKFSTIHSFKGWEINTVFLIIMPSDSAEENESDEGKINRYGESREELIYTGMTRAKEKLFIFNIGDTDLDKFYKANIESNDL